MTRKSNFSDFFVIAGPCVIESLDHALHTAVALAKVAEALNITIIYKSSFDKANRSAEGSRRGPGLEAGLAILTRVQTETGLQILTDVHEAAPVAVVADVISSTK